MNRVAIRVIGAPLILAGLALVVYVDHVRQVSTAVRVLIACLAAVSFHELCEMGRLKGLRPSEGLGLVAILTSWAHMIGVFGYDDFVVMSIGPIVVMAVALQLVISSKSFGPSDAGFTVLGVAYISLLLFIPIDSPNWGHSSQWIPVWTYWLLFLVATNKGSDMAAYIAGKLVGRHKMAPTISPNKTWEGAAAGLIAGTVLGCLCLGAWPRDTWWIDFPRPPKGTGLMILLAACTTVAAQFGDLVKSVIKRWAGVKDSGRFLPEFGGALDMIDSFILSAPTAYLLSRVLDRS
jgi:phosphatidate cytidylyltransferase